MTICFMDTETLGLDPMAPVWEFAAIRRDDDGKEEEFHAFFQHEEYKGKDSLDKWVDDLPTEFQLDYQSRFDPTKAMNFFEATAYVYAATRGAHVVGAVPSFDTERLGFLFRRCGMDTPWHYHLTDVENLVVGYLTATTGFVKPPWKSNELSLAVGVDPQDFPRHTAMGDVKWVRAQWDAVIGNAVVGSEQRPEG